MSRHAEKVIALIFESHRMSSSPRTVLSLSLSLSDGGDYVAMIRFGWRSAASTSLSLLFAMTRHLLLRSRSGSRAGYGVDDGRERFYCVSDHLAGLSRTKRWLPAWKGSPRSSRAETWISWWPPFSSPPLLLLFLFSWVFTLSPPSHPPWQSVTSSLANGDFYLTGCLSPVHVSNLLDSGKNVYLGLELRAMLPKSSSWPLPAKQPSHAIKSLSDLKSWYCTI